MPTNKELEQEIEGLRQQLRVLTLNWERVRSALIEVAAGASNSGDLTPAQMIVIRKALGQ